MTPETIGCTHLWQNGDGEPAACPECLEAEIERLSARLELLAGEQGAKWTHGWICPVCGTRNKPGQQACLCGEAEVVGIPVDEQTG